MAEETFDLFLFNCSTKQYGIAFEELLQPL